MNTKLVKIRMNFVNGEIADMNRPPRNRSMYLLSDLNETSILSHSKAPFSFGARQTNENPELSNWSPSRGPEMYATQTTGLIRAQ